LVVVENKTPAPEAQPARLGLSRGWLIAAWITWGLVTLLTLLLFIVSIPFRFNNLASIADLRPLLELGITATAYARYRIGLDIIVFVAHVVIASIIFLRRQDDWMALFVSMTLITNGALLALAQLFNINGVALLWLSLSRIVIFIGVVSSIVLLYIFPNGRFVPRLTKFLALSWAILMFISVFLPQSILSLTSWNVLLQFTVLFAWAGTGVYAQIFRYENVSAPAQRQQTKWALLGLLAAVVGPIVLLATIYASSGEAQVPNILYQRMGSGFFTMVFILRLVGITFFELASLLFPISFAIAVLRYRLWDIDIIIRRTLIYAALSGILVLIYLSSIVLLQQVLSIFTRASQLAVVISTLATAALFTPLRRRIQNSIDRRFYRNRYDAEKILASFSASLRDQVDLDQLQDRLLVVIEDSVQPEMVSLWLKEPEFATGGVDGESTG
jgi:hypothetical protein